MIEKDLLIATKSSTSSKIEAAALNGVMEVINVEKVALSSNTLWEMKTRVKAGQ